MTTSHQEKFYNLFWKNDCCQQLFLLHKEELLLKEEIEIGEEKKHFYLPRFVISNSLKRPKAIGVVEQRIENRTIDSNSSLQLKSDKNLSEEKITRYFNEKFGKPIELVTKKLNGNQFTQIKFIAEVLNSLGSEKRLMKLLHKYEAVPKNIRNFTELSAWFDKSIQKEVQKLIKPEHFTDLLSAADEIANHYSNFHYNSLLDAHEFYTDILFEKEGYQDRLAMLDSLYECKVLEGGVNKTYYECTHCDINVFSGSVTLNVTPSKVKLKCPNCNQEVFYLAPYRLHEDIVKDILAKDGLLSGAISYLLEGHKIKFQRNIKREADIELDIEIYNKLNTVTDIVEIKTLRTDKTEDVLISNLSEGLTKFIIAYDKLVQSNPKFRNVRFHYITNLDHAELYTQLRSTFRQQLRERPITIHTLATFKTYIESLSNR